MIERRPRARRASSALAIAAGLAAAWLVPAGARAQGTGGGAEHPTVGPAPPENAQGVSPVPPIAVPSFPLPALPPTQLNFLQYGAAVTVEGNVGTGRLCPANALTPCILGSGGGFEVRVGWRSHEGWYIGGNYEFSKMGAANLLNLPILQQLRGEVRRYLLTGVRLTPYVAGGAGLAGYGSTWKVNTFGPDASVSVGIEFETTRALFVGLAPAFRVLWLRGWTDATNQDRPGSLAEFLGLELTVETRTAFERW